MATSRLPRGAHTRAPVRRSGHIERGEVRGRDVGSVVLSDVSTWTTVRLDRQNKNMETSTQSVGPQSAAVASGAQVCDRHTETLVPT